jgi:hypothetical protein
MATQMPTEHCCESVQVWQVLPELPHCASDEPTWQVPDASQQPKGQSDGPHFLTGPQDSAVLIVRPKKRPTIIHLVVVIVRCSSRVWL